MIKWYFVQVNADSLDGLVDASLKLGFGTCYRRSFAKCVWPISFWSRTGVPIVLLHMLALCSGRGCLAEMAFDEHAWSHCDLTTLVMPGYLMR